MQRLSLESSSSSSSKLHVYGGRKDEPTHKDLISPSTSSSHLAIDYDDHDVKESKPKPRRFSLQSPLSPSHSRSEKLIHVIPVLTVICFFVLYLSSHPPSQSDLAQFSRFKQSTKHLESAEILEDSRFAELRRTDAFAIRSLRNLQEMEKYSPVSRHRRRSHRKIAGN